LVRLDHEADVEPLIRTIVVHVCAEQYTGYEGHALFNPVQGADAGISSTAVREYKIIRFVVIVSYIDSDAYALAAELVGCCFYQFRIIQGGWIDADFVCACSEQLADITDG